MDSIYVKYIFILGLLIETVHPCGWERETYEKYQLALERGRDSPLSLLGHLQLSLLLN